MWESVISLPAMRNAPLSLTFLVPRPSDCPSGIANVGIALRQAFSGMDGIEVNTLFAGIWRFAQGLPSVFHKPVLLLDYLFVVPFKVWRQRPDALVGVNGRLPPFLPKRCVKAVLVHDFVFKKYPRTMRFTGLLADRFFVEPSLARADIIFAISSSTARDLSAFYPRHAAKVVVVPIAGMPLAAPPPEAQSLVPTPYILFVGTMEPRKNLMRLIEAFAALPEALRKTFKLVLLGGAGWGGLNLSREIAARGLQDQVILTGYVSETMLAAMYRDAYCLAMPSLYEGFGMPLLEAQSFGVPVVTSNVSSMPEVAGDGAVLVDPAQVPSIAQGLEIILTQIGLRNELAAKAGQNVRNYSWDKTAGAMIAEIRKRIYDHAGRT